MDNADPCDRIVVYDHETFPISSQEDAMEWNASGKLQGHSSSVKVFQWPGPANGGQPMGSYGNSQATSLQEVGEGESVMDDGGQLSVHMVDQSWPTWTAGVAVRSVREYLETNVGPSVSSTGSTGDDHVPLEID